MGANALKTWRAFESRFKEMGDRITFWLFQMPPIFNATTENVRPLSQFFSGLNLGNSAVIEFRHASWWDEKSVCKEAGVAFCSVDAPSLPREIVSVNNVVYLRLHGRGAWYAYVYSERELNAIIDEIKKLDACKEYVYLNNDHGMLPNGKFLMCHL